MTGGFGRLPGAARRYLDVSRSSPRKERSRPGFEFAAPRPAGSGKSAARKKAAFPTDLYQVALEILERYLSWLTFSKPTETDTAEKIERRVAHDLSYIENWSMMLDRRILALTPLSLLTAKNAY